MHRFSLSLQHLGKIRSLKSAIPITITRFQIPRRQVYSKAKEMALYDPIQPYKTGTMLLSSSLRPKLKQGCPNRSLTFWYGGC